MMQATATIPTIPAPFQVYCACLQEDEWRGVRRNSRWLRSRRANHLKSSLFAIFTRYTRTWVSEVCVLNIWLYVRKILVTLTTIATLRCNVGVGMSVMPGSRWDLVHCCFTSTIQTYFRLFLFVRFCDYPCSDSVQLRAGQILRFNRLSTRTRLKLIGSDCTAFGSVYTAHLV